MLPSQPAPLAQVPSEEEKHKESASTSSPQKQQKAKHDGDRDRHMQLLRTILFESAYDLVTWVLIALAVGSVLLFYSTKNWRGLLWAGCALVCLTAIMVALKAQHHISVFAEQPPTPSPALTATPTPQELHGLLIPANEPTPPHTCSETTPNVVMVFAGKVAFWTKQPMTAINMMGFDLLSLNKVEGGINVSARMLSADNKVVAQITNNEFYVNPPDFPFQLKRPDWHTLVVLDHRGNEALYIYYLNPHAIKFRGRFYAPGSTPVIVTDEWLEVPGGNRIFGGCYGGMPIGMQVGRSD